MRKLFGKVKRYVIGGMVAAITAVATIVTASASTATTVDMASVVSTAGDALSIQLVTMVTALVPTLVGVAVAGLGMYAIIMLFTMGKNLFNKAAK